MEELIFQFKIGLDHPAINDMLHYFFNEIAYKEKVRTQINFMWFSEDRRVKISSFMDNRMIQTLSRINQYVDLAWLGFQLRVYNESLLMLRQFFGHQILSVVVTMNPLFLS